MKDKFINLYLIFSCLIEIKKTRHKKKKKTPREKKVQISNLSTKKKCESN